RAEAEKALQRAGIKPNFNPKALCTSAGGLEVDLMRPWGHYVGVDESIPTEGDLSPSISVPNASATSSGPDNAIPSQSTNLNAGPNPTADAETNQTDYEDLDLSIEHLLSPCMPSGRSEDDDIQGPDGSIKRGWVKYNSRWVHLESATRLILGTESTEKSSDRLRRVYGLTRYPSLNTQSDSILGDICLIGQPILGLIRVDNVVALAAVRVTSIQIGSAPSPIESISINHLNRPDVTMTGQILSLDFDGGVWYWNQCYVMSGSPKGKQTDATNNKPLLIRFHAQTIELVNPTILERHGQLVWSFEHQELMAAIELLWSKSSESLQDIPVQPKLANFPYYWQTAAGLQMLMHHDATEAIERMPAEKCGMCYLCGNMVPIKQCMRIHVAKHILAKQLGTKDLLLDGNEVSYAPCGFCGRSGFSECRVTLKMNKKSTSIKSGCPFFDKFSYKPVETSTISSPCTNRPMRCGYPQCSNIDPVWSYNMRDHILASHGQAAYNRTVDEGQFRVSSEEIGYLQLGKLYLVPGRRGLVLPGVPSQSTKRPIEDSTRTDVGPAPPSTHL
ncbi:hypothetical protein FRC11_001225, partial [Ceratobasidium sp. 423]